MLCKSASGLSLATPSDGDEPGPLHGGEAGVEAAYEAELNVKDVKQLLCAEAFSATATAAVVTPGCQTDKERSCPFPANKWVQQLRHDLQQLHLLAAEKGLTPPLLSDPGLSGAANLILPGIAVSAEVAFKHTLVADRCSC